MEELSEESKAIIARFEVHRDRCLLIKERLGTVASKYYHERWRSDPANAVAEKEFEILMQGN
jgi:hypothetical protein